MDADCTIVDPDGVTLPAGCEAWSVLAELDTGSGSQAHNQPLSITLDSQMVDFAPGTAMAIFDVYANASLGVHTGSFVSKLIPPHGVQLLRIAFSPVY